ncbi:MAG TPA: 3-deoxy-7-phosphoheptulonate synthase [Pseudomonadales bacterium]|nr:3-deoxy-7-phosphoheptulonate synthase [Pseudomonadales bacterium]
MTDRTLENLNVETIRELITPAQLKAEMPLTAAVDSAIRSARGVVRNILDRRDQRLFLVVGPCSIHDPASALDYARRLRELAHEVEDTLFLVMRVYFEKPRTTTGWKGLVNDPHLNDSFRIEEGLRIARKLLIDIVSLGLPAATEALDPISPQYLQDLIAWSAIGARTTESQTHREMASGLSCAVGFKNGTDGGLTVAINALKSVSSPHRFLGIDSKGRVAVIHTRGNPHGHIVLRGGTQGPNYDSVHIALCERELAAAGVPRNIVVDCSHANSNKDHALQALVLDNIANQIIEGNRSIVGAMLESNLEAGNQPIPADLSQLRYGVSVTDACMDWNDTERAIRSLHSKIRNILPQRTP